MYVCIYQGETNDFEKWAQETIYEFKESVDSDVS